MTKPKTLAERQESPGFMAGLIFIAILGAFFYFAMTGFPEIGLRKTGVAYEPIRFEDLQEGDRVQVGSALQGGSTRIITLTEKVPDGSDGWVWEGVDSNGEPDAVYPNYQGILLVERPPTQDPDLGAPGNDRNPPARGDSPPSGGVTDGDGTFWEPTSGQVNGQTVLRTLDGRMGVLIYRDGDYKIVEVQQTTTGNYEITDRVQYDFADDSLPTDAGAGEIPPSLEDVAGDERDRAYQSQGYRIVSGGPITIYEKIENGKTTRVTYYDGIVHPDGIQSVITITQGGVSRTRTDYHDGRMKYSESKNGQSIHTLYDRNGDEIDKYVLKDGIEYRSGSPEYNEVENLFQEETQSRPPGVGDDFASTPRDETYRLDGYEITTQGLITRYTKREADGKITIVTYYDGSHADIQSETTIIQDGVSSTRIDYIGGDTEYSFSKDGRSIHYVQNRNGEVIDKYVIANGQRYREGSPEYSAVESYLASSLTPAKPTGPEIVSPATLNDVLNEFENENPDARRTRDTITVNEVKVPIYKDDDGNYYVYDASPFSGEDPGFYSVGDGRTVPMTYGTDSYQVELKVDEDGDLSIGKVTYQKPNGEWTHAEFDGSFDEFQDLANKVEDTGGQLESEVADDRTTWKITKDGKDVYSITFSEDGNLKTEIEYDDKGRPSKVVSTNVDTGMRTTTTYRDEEVYFDPETGEYITKEQAKEKDIDATTIRKQTTEIRVKGYVVSRITTQMTSRKLENGQYEMYGEVRGYGHRLEQVDEDGNTIGEEHFYSYYGAYDPHTGEGYAIRVDEEGNYQYLQMVDGYWVDIADVSGGREDYTGSIVDIRNKIKEITGMTDEELDKEIEKRERQAKRADQRRQYYEFISTFTDFSGLAGYSALFIDEETLAEWREMVDSWFAAAYLGTEYWTSEICAMQVEVDTESVAWVETPNGIITPAASIKGERVILPDIETGDLDYVYKITYFIRNQRSAIQRAEFRDKPVSFNLVLHPGAIEIFNEDKEVEPGASIGASSAQPFVFESTQHFTTVCIEFKTTFYALDDRMRPERIDEICDRLSEYEGGSVPWEEPVAGGDGAGTGPGGEINPGIH